MEPKRSIFSVFGQQVTTLLALVALLWVIETADWLVFANKLPQWFGIRPLTVSGLWGILFAPFLHGSFAHLFANTLPLLTLGWLVMLRGRGEWAAVSAIAALCSGLGTWLFGNLGSYGGVGTTHIGASGVIFGYLGFLLFRGYFERSFTAIAFSLLIGLLYGGVVLGGFLPQAGISWQGHLFGFLGGVLSARLLAKPQRPAGQYEDL